MKRNAAYELFAESSGMNKVPLVIINSPTATGKTELAIKLAQTFGGEIISADSLQVYRHLDIGTAKPTIEQRNKVRHHLIDVVNPDEEFNAAIYTSHASRVIENLSQSGKPIIVAGGTGLYIRALLKGIIETPQVDEGVRNYYRRLRDQEGKECLHKLLSQRDKEAAARINPHDSVRVIRALEVLEQTGESIVAIQKKHSLQECFYQTCKIGLMIDRPELKKRIAERTDKMIAAGLLDEVSALLARGYGDNLKPMQSLGYRQVIDFLKGACDWEKAVNLIKRQTWLYAKRQMTWFAADKEIKWHTSESLAEIEKDVSSFLKQAGEAAK
jgi:tRNA dimethylallyltransferase